VEPGICPSTTFERLGRRKHRRCVRADFFAERNTPRRSSRLTRDRVVQSLRPPPPIGRACSMAIQPWSGPLRSDCATAHHPPPWGFFIQVALLADESRRDSSARDADSHSCQWASRSTGLKEVPRGRARRAPRWEYYMVDAGTHSVRRRPRSSRSVSHCTAGPCESVPNCRQR